MKLKTLIAAFLLIGLAGSPLAALAQDRSDARIEQPWARASIGTSRPSAAYLTAENRGSAPVRIVGVETPVAGRAEIHRIARNGDVLSMQPAGDIEILPGERVTLAPGGLHVMLMKLKEPIIKGSTFPLVLRFSNGEKIDVVVPVFGPGARGPGQ